MGNKGDYWSEIVGSDEHEKDPSSIAVVYKRRKSVGDRDIITTTKHVQILPAINENRLSLPPNKRISWRRSLSTRGRTSILISADAGYQQLKKKEARKKTKNAPPKRNVQLLNHEKERLQAYFEDVDSFELAEESPSPKNFGTWNMGAQISQFPLTDVSSRLGKWLASKKLDYSVGPSARLSNILETPSVPLESICSESSEPSSERTPERASKPTSLGFSSLNCRLDSDLMNLDVIEEHTFSPNGNMRAVNLGNEGSKDLEEDFRRLSMSPQLAVSIEEHQDPYITLLKVCKQSAPSTLLDVLSQYCNPDDIIKIGEGTYGEAFKAGAMVCKIVPFDGDLRVNGEIQKRSAELLEEVLLSRTLNSLKGNGCQVNNACTNFIETLDLRVCQGSYDSALIKAWVEWDVKNRSQNDHPKEFSEEQCYVVFVLAHGGEDLEHFVLADFNQARSVLVQVTAALAVAEAAYEFEHRDLHWGNILLSHNELASVPFTLEGKKKFAKSFGLSVSIIDFTLSRINTGKSIHFLDLSSDPELFNGKKNDKQAITYREMKKVTEDFWEGSFPKTNVLWLQYLVDILLDKKSFKRTSADARELRRLKMHLFGCCSAKEALDDPFFSDLLMDDAI
ncbi:non-specific serine/threonine protein kinase [Ranunculus cassubicifolius]